MNNSSLMVVLWYIGGIVVYFGRVGGAAEVNWVHLSLTFRFHPRLEPPDWVLSPLHRQNSNLPGCWPFPNASTFDSLVQSVLL